MALLTGNWTAPTRRQVAGYLMTLLLGAIAIGTSASSRGAGVAEPPQRQPRKRALLVGVTAFDNQSAIKAPALQAPVNDVQLFKNVLTSRFGLVDGDIRILADLPRVAVGRPTRDNIRQEFERLFDAQKGDHIVIFLAGHGSQQPANADPGGDDPEPDGFDEIFLPADVGAWDGGRGTVTNAIVDDDIRAWLNQIRRNGASVWVIFDSCFSGTMTRGSPAEVERERQVSMEDLNIPREAILAGRTRRGNARLTPGGPNETTLGVSDSAGEIAALYAADTNEKTKEMRHEPGNSPYYGLFTYTIAQVLNQASRPMTYRDLAHRVLDAYRARQRFESTPTFEGGGLDTEILGQRTWPARPALLISGGAKDLTVNGGTILGISAGAVLEVFPAAGTARADVAIGHVKVADAQAMRSRVEPTAFGKVPPPAVSRLVPGSRARIVHYGPGQGQMRVAVQQRAGTAPDGEPAYRTMPVGGASPAVEAALRSLPAATNGMVARVATADADWLLREENGNLYLVPASGWHPDSAPGYGCDAQYQVVNPNPIREYRLGAIVDAGLETEVTSVLRKIARVRQLQALRSPAESASAFELEVARFDKEAGGVPQPLLRPPYRNATVFGGEYLGFTMRNIGKTPLDVTLLYVDAYFRISAIFPRRNQQVDIRLNPGETRTHREEIVPCPIGWESTVAIAVEPQDARRINFALLEQDGIPAAMRGADDAPSPLRDLLESLAFGRTRNGDGPTTQPLDRFAVKVVAWRTELTR